MNILKTLTIADTATLAGAAAGFLSLLFASQQRFMLAAGFLVAAVVLDWADGRIARLQKQAHPFGRELDSLADVISFGAAPAVFGYLLAGSTRTAGVVSVLFLFCGIVRLARFNCSTRHCSYEGVPITVNGVVFPLLFWLGAPPLTYTAAFVVMGVLMISTFTVRKW